MTLVWRPGYGGAAVSDPDAMAYLRAVEEADNQPLEQGVQQAVNQFVIGCKNDGIWDAIKASCILAGARTLNGALVPLVGTAPTNYNFVSGDYNRETGLKGDGSTKYISTGRNSNQDPLNSFHLAVYVTEPETGTGHYISGEITGQRNGIYGGNPVYTNIKNGGAVLNTNINGTTVTGIIAASRDSSASISYKFGSTQATASSASVVSPDQVIVVGARSIGGAISAYSVARYAFYSIGESLDLAALDTRVSNLMTAIGAAIP